MKTYTMCGSMRYAEQMQRIAFELETAYGYNILQCTYGGGELSETEKNNIVKAHYKKIDLSDGIYVADIDGYTGQSVKEEMAYAEENGKEIVYHSRFWEENSRK
ncbi:MAG: hypothetical protein IJO54_04465 [Oscillospiraceae bacterium]|nr:hypothetical protein [Oscillospiraceae bacterium]